jgi:hypothetical protein
MLMNKERVKRQFFLVGAAIAGLLTAFASGAGVALAVKGKVDVDRALEDKLVAIGSTLEASEEADMEITSGLQALLVSTSMSNNIQYLGFQGKQLLEEVDGKVNRSGFS